ncbi:MAG: preprotein translocase subunit SecE [Acidobacteriota bacterium]
MFSVTGSWKKLTTFLSETRAEVKKVTFPSRPEVMSTTVVVIVASFIFAFYLWIADIVILKCYEGIFRVLS